MPEQFAMTDAMLLALLRNDKEAAARLPIGYAVAAQRVYTVPVVEEGVRLMATNDDFVPEQDIYRYEADGRAILEAPAGVPIPRADAERRGLLKGYQEVGPSEIKVTKEGVRVFTPAAVQGDPNADIETKQVEPERVELHEAPKPEEARASAGENAPAVASADEGNAAPKRGRK